MWLNKKGIYLLFLTTLSDNCLKIITTDCEIYNIYRNIMYDSNNTLVQRK